jgi:hypothetical protein
MPKGPQLAAPDPLVLVYVVCVFAAALLIPALLYRYVFPPRPSDSDSDDGWGNGPPEPPSPPRGGIPLADAQPAQLRLREHGRLTDRLPAGERRPAREPDPGPAPTPRPAGPAIGIRRRS